MPETPASSMPPKSPLYEEKTHIATNKSPNIYTDIQTRERQFSRIREDTILLPREIAGMHLRITDESFRRKTS